MVDTSMRFQKKWDEEFMIKNQWISPVVEDYENDHSSDIALIYRKMVTGKYLLKKWGIQF